MNKAICEIGIAGLDSVGASLALKIADHGYSVAAYDRNEPARDNLRPEFAEGRIEVANTLREFVSLLGLPRTVMIVLQAGLPIDDMINSLLTVLSPGDLIIEAGNSYFKDTDVRSNMLAGKGIELLGVGLAGRERGIRFGVSIMPGGSAHAYDRVRRILEDIATEVNGEPCVTYLGPRSAGHYVEMVYSAIEHAMIQLIAETYCLMSRALGMSDAALQEVYALWGDSEVNSNLLEIIAHTPPGNDGGIIGTLFELIGDEATKNGSGRLASLEARYLNVSTPTIDIALAIGTLSSLEEGRVALRRLFMRRPVSYVGKLDILIEQTKRALYAGMILAFAQGVALLRAASDAYKYDLALEDVVRIWRGSLIRSPLLQNVCDALYVQPRLSTLLSDPQFAHCLRARREDLRDVVRLSVEHGIPAPALTASLVYYDAHRGLGPDGPQASVPQHVSGFSEDLSGSDGTRTTCDAGNRSLPQKHAVRRIST
ncbi:MAG: phosphogluconate dehydrogenase (NADP(+)-dependent, decarboxylating) [Acidobacteria bacterium]|nr:MAG: phosphogluconate dehydrogenase (NADP(+)-dependent, decarboxylating) [Acidobacteriota bacterium]